MAELYIGLMSGTSMDALDAVLVDFAQTTPRLIATRSEPITPELRKGLLDLALPGANELERLAQLDVQFGRLSAGLCQQLLTAAAVNPNKVRAIGSHGQTVRHAPHATPPYTVQIGDPNTIAQLSGITTVADFRRRDIAAGGEGAPLVPAFHRALFQHPDRTRVILNIGGIANISILPAAAATVSGFDTGPGNMLMDAWSQLYQGRPYDQGGQWARSGQVDTELLASLLDTPYFNTPPPKSTGREYFNLQWLEQHLHEGHRPADVQATLCELTAASIALAIRGHAPECTELFVCGGGWRNDYLLERLRSALPEFQISCTSDLGIDPQWMEAMAFAWLARQTLLGLPGNLPAVTGAHEAVPLGGVYPATRR